MNITYENTFIMHAYSQYLEEIYRAKIEAYTNQKVEYIGETINGKRAVVETLIITDSTKIRVNT